MIYRGFSLDHINTYMLSEPFTIWGIIWLLAGYAGLPLFFLVGFCAQAIFSLIRVFPPKFQVFLCSAYMFVPLSLTYLSFGIDHQLIATTYFAASIIVAWILIVLLSKFVKIPIRTGTVFRNEEEN